MCGIFGYIGQREAIQECIRGLEGLEYRGYDSSGVAGIDSLGICVYKKAGKLRALQELLSEKSFNYRLAIGHTRWATHGVPSNTNAHPHMDMHQTVAVVHNGVIENYLSLKQDLEGKQVLFKSETDTEVIPNLIAQEYSGDFFIACVRAFAHLEGSYALAIIHKNHLDEMIVTAEKSPLVVGFNPETFECYISSDPVALAGKNLMLYSLSGGDIAVLQKGKKPFFSDKNGLNKLIHSFDNSLAKSSISKGGFEHFMLKEIFEQEKSVFDAFNGRIDHVNHQVIFEELTPLMSDLNRCEQIQIVACGTSFHAALVANYFFESISHISTKVEIASEFRYKTWIRQENTIFLALSQSGETADTIECVKAVRSEGFKIISLCNCTGSALYRESDVSLMLRAGPEVAVASTKTFTSQVTVLYLLAIYLAQQKGLNIEKKRLLEELVLLPSKVSQILENHRNIQSKAIQFASYHDVYFLGRGVSYPVALEAALKLKEIAYVNACGFAAGEMKHGPIALLDTKVPVIAFCCSLSLEKKMISNIMECKARNSPILIFGFPDFKKDLLFASEEIIFIPSTSQELSCILLAVATQLFAYYVAKAKHLDIDKPRNLAKSVTVE